MNIESRDKYNAEKEKFRLSTPITYQTVEELPGLFSLR
jgi:hypothetical protein